MLTLACLRAQIRLYKRAGMANAVVDMQEDMRSKMDERYKEREARDAKLLRQKSMAMEMRQQARLAKVLEAQEREKQNQKAAHEGEFASLVDAQARDLHELQETVTGMIALGLSWAPTEKTSKPWMAQLKKNRFRTSWKLSELQSHIDKLLSGTGHVTAKTAELQRQASEMLKREHAEWHERLMNTALGEHTSSIVSQLVASQKVAQAKMHDHHTQKLRLSEKQQAAAVKMLSGQFRLEKIQLQDKFKQRSACLTRHTLRPI